MEATLEAFRIFFRWAHVLFGILWIGNSFFFNWMISNFEKLDKPKEGVEGELWMLHGGGFFQVEKKTLDPRWIPKVLHWFKYESYFTWLTGFILLTLVYYLSGGMYLIKDGSQYCFVGYNQFFNSNIDKFNVVNLNAILDFKSLNSFPKKKYIIKGIIKTNIPKYDNSIFINYDSLLFNKNVFLKINLNHPLTINSLTDLNEKFGEGILYHNNTEFSELFYAINFEKMFYGFVGLSIILISSLMILGFNIISITENSSKIGMLNALGLSNKKISLYYVFYGLLISFSGFLISLFCFFIIFYFDKNFNIMHYIFNPEVYFNFKLNINYEVLINVFLLNTVLIILSCLYPIHKMSKLDIIDSISNRV